MPIGSFTVLFAGLAVQGRPKVQVPRVQSEAYFDGVESHHTVTRQATLMALLKNEPAPHALDPSAKTGYARADQTYGWA